MMPRHLFAIAVAVMLSACTSPAPFYLTLDVPSAPVAAQTGQRVVVVGPVSVPESVDRIQVMLNVGAHQLEPASNLRWAQPYKLEVARALAAYLAQALGNPYVVPVLTAPPAEPFLRVGVDVLGFEQRDGQYIVLDILWSVRDSGTGKVIASQRRVLRESVSGSGGEALAAAQGKALAAIARDIAAALK